MKIKWNYFRLMLQINKILILFLIMFGLFVLIRLNAYVLLSSWELILNSSMPGLERRDFFPSVTNVRKLCRPQKHFFKQNWSKLDRMSEFKEKQTFLWEFNNNSIVLTKTRNRLILLYWSADSFQQTLRFWNKLSATKYNRCFTNAYRFLFDFKLSKLSTWTTESDWNKNCRPFLVNDDTIICQQCIHQLENLKNLEEITM